MIGTLIFHCLKDRSPYYIRDIKSLGHAQYRDNDLREFV